MTRGGMPPALLHVDELRGALERIPSKQEVELWVDAWPLLDDVLGIGHTARLERALISIAATENRAGFRAVWVFALLAESGSWSQSIAASAWLELFHRYVSPSHRREVIRGMLHLPLSVAEMGDLLAWAVEVVFLEDGPASRSHQALRIIEMGMNSMAVQHVDKPAVQAALRHVFRQSRKGHTKKKAAQLMARHFSE